jgi:hypothetical protein
MTDKKPNTRPEKAEYAICWDAGFIAGKAEAFEQGKLAQTKFARKICENMRANHPNEECEKCNGMLEMVVVLENRLKSQLSRGEQGDLDEIPKGKRGTIRERLERVEASRNPESLKKCKECGLACGGGKKKEGSE